MKKNIFVLLLLVGIVFNSNSQIIFNYKQFQLPNGKMYVENYISFLASSVKYKMNKNKKLQAKLLVTQVLKQKDSIIGYKKYTVKSPELIDRLALDFKDKTEFVLASGTYNIELEVQDLNRNNSKAFRIFKVIEVESYWKKINISGIEFVDYLKKTKKKNKFSKSGFDIYPLVSNYLPYEMEKLAYYFEIYNKGKLETTLVNQYIETYGSHKKMEASFKRKIVKLKNINSQINVFDIKKLPSGNYNLVIEIRNSLNKIITKKKVFFQRINDLNENVEVKKDDSPIHLPKDSIDYFLGSIIPIANNTEHKILKYKKMTYGQKKNYFTSFWVNRNSTNPNGQWKYYYEKVKQVEKKYGNLIKKGFETDMGRVFLKYGKPNDIIEKLFEQGTYPYVMWHYYNTEKQSNVMFVFYNTTAASRDMELIHSTMKNEIFNANWKYLVNLRTNGTDSKTTEDEQRMR